MDIITQAKLKGSIKTDQKGLNKWFNRVVKTVEGQNLNTYVQYITPYEILPKESVEYILGDKIDAKTNNLSNTDCSDDIEPTCTGDGA